MTRREAIAWLALVAAIFYLSPSVQQLGAALARRPFNPPEL